MTLIDRLRATVTDLHQAEATFALVGGLAVSARAEPRFTRDADLAVAVANDAEAEALIVRLRHRGYAVSAVVEQAATGRLATVRLVTQADETQIITDLLFASCGIETDVVADAEELQIVRDLVVPVARSGHLMAMKLLARDDRSRPADADDLRALAVVATTADWTLCQQACADIADRGYHRGRDLVALFDQYRLDNGPLQ